MVEIYFINGYYIAATQVDSRLTSRATRQTWETQFAAVFLTPVLQHLDQILQTANTAITNDNRLGKLHEDPMAILISKGNGNRNRCHALYIL